MGGHATRRSRCGARTGGTRTPTTFDYDYPDEELRGLAAEAARLAYRERNTHITFNNCDEDKRRRSGIMFMKMLLVHGYMQGVLRRDGVLFSRVVTESLRL